MQEDLQDALRRFERACELSDRLDFEVGSIIAEKLSRWGPFAGETRMSIEYIRHLMSVREGQLFLAFALGCLYTQYVKWYEQDDTVVIPDFIGALRSELLSMPYPCPEDALSYLGWLTLLSSESSLASKLEILFTRHFPLNIREEAWNYVTPIWSSVRPDYGDAHRRELVHLLERSERSLEDRENIWNRLLDMQPRRGEWEMLRAELGLPTERGR